MKQILKKFYRRVVLLSNTANGFIAHHDIIHITTMLGGIAERVPTKFLGELDLASPDIVADDVTVDIRLLLFTNVTKWKAEKIQSILGKCPNVVICIISAVPLNELEVNKFSAFNAPEEDGWSGFFIDSGIEKREQKTLCDILEDVAQFYLAPGLVNFLETHDGGILATRERIHTLEDEAGDLFVQFLHDKTEPDRNYYYDQMLEKSNDFIGHEKPPIDMVSFKKWVKEYARVAKLRLLETQTNNGEAFRFLPMRLK
jgi:hypothetical protein